VDGVPWERLHHAYGTAADVPDLLRALRSPDDDTRHQAHYRLRGNIYHQGTRWEASSHAIPSLVRLADDRATPERGLVVRLLRLVGLGDVRDEDLPFDPAAAFAGAEDATDEDVAWLVEALYDEEKDLDEVPMEVQVAVDARWRRDCYRAAAAHVATYRTWLMDGDAEVGAHAAELLAWFPADDATVAALLEPPQATVRASANLTLAHLGPDSTVDAALTQQLGSDVIEIRRTAAIALAYRLGGQLPEAAVDVLTGPSSPRTAVPGWNRALDGFVSLAVRRAQAT
jgi:HEAT repeat protein